MSAADKIAAARALIEPLRATVLWQNANPNVMKAADLLAALADLADAQAQENARLRSALEEIANLKERRESKYPTDWREQIAACRECQKYKDHPIQQGICDTHRQPIYAQWDHDANETKILGYRAISIARAALPTPSPETAP